MYLTVLSGMIIFSLIFYLVWLFFS